MTGLAASVLALVTALAESQGAPVKCINIGDAVAAERMLPVTVTEDGRRLLGTQDRPFLNVRFTGSVLAPPSTTTRLLQGTPPGTEFMFTREGQYLVSLYSAPAFGWPHQDATGTLISGCAEQPVEVTAVQLREFRGVRSHGWAGVRLLTSTELEGGASLFVGRLGFAGTISLTAFGEPKNRWVPGIDVRWRGARGYLGGGVRYFARDAGNHERFRPVAVAGQELPPFKGLPTWFVLDVRVDEYRRKFWRGLDVSFGLRIDLTGNRP